MPKGMKFGRKMVMDFAKIIRNASMSNSARLQLGRELSDYFQIADQFFDRKMFMSVLIGTLDFDPKTERFSGVNKDGEIRYPSHLVCTCEKRGTCGGDSEESS